MDRGLYRCIDMEIYLTNCSHTSSRKHYKLIFVAGGAGGQFPCSWQTAWLLVSSIRREGHQGWSHSAESPSHLTTLNIDQRRGQLSLQRSRSKVVMTGEQQSSL